MSKGPVGHPVKANIFFPTNCTVFSIFRHLLFLSRGIFGLFDQSNHRRIFGQIISLIESALFYNPIVSRYPVATCTNGTHHTPPRSLQNKNDRHRCYYCCDSPREFRRSLRGFRCLVAVTVVSRQQQQCQWRFSVVVSWRDSPAICSHDEFCVGQRFGGSAADVRLAVVGEGECSPMLLLEGYVGAS